MAMLCMFTSCQNVQSRRNCTKDHSVYIMNIVKAAGVSYIRLSAVCRLPVLKAAAFAAGE